MDTEIKKPVESLINANSDEFNFELWARKVKPQLIAALQKRTTQR